MNNYDVIIIGAGPGGIFGAYELIEKNPDCKIAVFEAGHELAKRKCPIDGKKIKSCISCKSCSIMSGFGGAGAFSDGKYNITNDFGGTLYEHIGKQPAIDLMEYVDEINMKYGGEGTKLYSTAGTKLKKVCMQNKLKLLDASVRHLGTDINYVVLENMYAHLKDKVDFYFDTPVESVEVLYDENTAGADACSSEEAHTDNVSGYAVKTADSTYESRYCIISVGRSGSKWMEKVCNDLDIPTKSNRVDMFVAVGGGSPMDASKAISMLAKNGIVCENAEFSESESVVKAEKCELPDSIAKVEELLYTPAKLPFYPIVCVPTTCGTGSEATPYSILTSHIKQTKKSIAHKIFPSLALVDYSYLKTSSYGGMKSTCVDALAHMIESRLNTNANAFSCAYAEEGMKLWASCKGCLETEESIDSGCA